MSYRVSQKIKLQPIIHIFTKILHKFHRFISHEAVSIFGEDLEKYCGLLFGATLYISNCIAAVSIAFLIVLLTIFCASYYLLLLSLLISLLFSFILYFISFYFHYVFSV